MNRYDVLLKDGRRCMVVAYKSPKIGETVRGPIILTPAQWAVRSVREPKEIVGVAVEVNDIPL